MKKFTKETARRAFRTFVQAALAYIAVNIVVIDFNSGKEVLRSALIGLAGSAVAAGLAAVMNLETEYEEVEDYNDEGAEDTITNEDFETEEVGEIDG